MLQHASRFLENNSKNFHSQVIEQTVQNVRSRFQHLLTLSAELDAVLTYNLSENGQRQPVFFISLFIKLYYALERRFVFGSL